MTYNINIVSRPIGSLNTSIEIYTYNLLKALNNILIGSHLLRNKIEITFIATGKYVFPYGTVLSPIGYDVIGAFFQGFNILGRGVKADVIHVLHHVNSLTLIATRGHGYPIKIVTIHHVPESLDPDFNRIVIKFLRTVLEHVKTDDAINIAYRAYNSNLCLKSPIFSRYDSSMFKLAIKNTDAVIAVSSLTALELRKLFPKEIKNKRIFITPLGSIDFDKRIPVKSITIKNEGEKFVVGYVGAHSFRKGILLLPILAYYAKKYGLSSSRFRIEVWGEGPLTSIVYRISKKLNVDDTLKVMGTFYRKLLPRIYKRFSVHVFPTLKEGFGLPIVEAATFGIPTIVLSYAKIPSEVKIMALEARDVEDIAKILVDLAENRDLLNEAMQKSLSYSRKFTWKRTALTTLEAYLEVLKQ